MEKIINLDINDRAFKAINGGTKRIEIRVTTNKAKKDYGVINSNDIIVFSNSKNEKLECQVIENMDITVVKSRNGVGSITTLCLIESLVKSAMLN